MSRNARFAALLMLCAGTAAGQEALPKLPEVMADVQDTEVYLQGFIGRGPEGVVRFVLPEVTDNGFPVDFESDVDLDKAITGCGFDGSGGQPCKMAGYGYLKWDQSRLHVILTSIETLDPPTARK